MKFKLFLLIAIVLTFTNCKKENQLYNTIEGRWKLFKTFSTGNYLDYPNPENQIIIEFKSNQDHIIYDFNGNETGRSKYELTKTSIILYGEGFRFESLYWIDIDTLRIRSDGGFEFSDGYYIRLGNETDKLLTLN